MQVNLPFHLLKKLSLFYVIYFKPYLRLFNSVQPYYLHDQDYFKRREEAALVTSKGSKICPQASTKLTH